MVVKFSQVDGGVSFEVEADVSSINGDENYVAVGLSTDDKMGDDAVVGCYGNSVVNYWNTADPFFAWPLKV